MNVVDIIAFVCIGVGVAALLFVIFIKIQDKFLKQYFVHWEDRDGSQFYSMVIAYGVCRAARKCYKSNPVVYRINKVVRDTRIAR